MIFIGGDAVLMASMDVTGLGSNISSRISGGDSFGFY